MGVAVHTPACGVLEGMRLRLICLCRTQTHNLIKWTFLTTDSLVHLSIHHRSAMSQQLVYASYKRDIVESSKWWSTIKLNDGMNPHTMPREGHFSFVVFLPQANPSRQIQTEGHCTKHLTGPPPNCYGHQHQGKSESSLRKHDDQMQCSVLGESQSRKEKLGEKLVKSEYTGELS